MPGARRTVTANPADVDQATNTFVDDRDVYDNILASDLRYIDTSPEGYRSSPRTLCLPIPGQRPTLPPGAADRQLHHGRRPGSLLDLYNDDLLPGHRAHQPEHAPASFDFNDQHRGFTELKYSKSNANFTGQPSYDYGLWVPLDNPHIYIPAVIRQDFLNKRQTARTSRACCSSSAIPSATAFWWPGTTSTWDRPPGSSTAKRCAPCWGLKAT